MRFNCLVVDPPYGFEDSLKMSSIKRSASSNYDTMSMVDIKSLPIKDIADPSGAILALWVPSSMVADGLDIMRSWNFDLKQIYVWVKTKKSESITSKIKKDVVSVLRKVNDNDIKLKSLVPSLKDVIFTAGDWLLQFGMGHLFRQCHEICLIGINNTAIYKRLEDRSQRSVCFSTNLKHSAKPENLQDSLDLMFPDLEMNRIEIFARRQRKGYLCLGNQTPMTEQEDIRVSLDKLKRMSITDEKKIKSYLRDEDYKALKVKWDML